MCVNKNQCFFFLDSDHSVVLKEITVPLWQNSECEKTLRKHFGPRYSLPDTAICAGAEGRDACDVSTFSNIITIIK